MLVEQFVYRDECPALTLSGARDGTLRSVYSARSNHWYWLHARADESVEEMGLDLTEDNERAYNH